MVMGSMTKAGYLMLFWVINDRFICGKYTKVLNKRRGRNAEMCVVSECGRYSYVGMKW
jgi:hypothetical protein